MRSGSCFCGEALGEREARLRGPGWSCARALAGTWSGGDGVPLWRRREEEGGLKRGEEKRYLRRVWVVMLWRRMRFLGLEARDGIECKPHCGVVEIPVG